MFLSIFIYFMLNYMQKESEGDLESWKELNKTRLGKRCNSSATWHIFHRFCALVWLHESSAALGGVAAPCLSPTFALQRRLLENLRNAPRRHWGPSPKKKKQFDCKLELGESSTAKGCYPQLPTLSSEQIRESGTKGEPSRLRRLSMHLGKISPSGVSLGKHVLWPSG